MKMVINLPSTTINVAERFRKKISRFSNSAHIILPKEFLGKEVYVVIPRKINTNKNILSKIESMDSKKFSMRPFDYSKYVKKRYVTDPLFKLRVIISSQINNSFNYLGRKKNNRKWESLLGYSTEQLKEHLEKQFDSKMSWGNHGSYWHIDHIVPTSSAKNEKELIELFKLNNLRPLEAKANISKGNKLFTVSLGGN